MNNNRAFKQIKRKNLTSEDYVVYRAYGIEKTDFIKLTLWDLNITQWQDSCTPS